MYRSEQGLQRYTRVMGGGQALTSMWFNTTPRARLRGYVLGTRPIPASRSFVAALLSTYAMASLFAYSSSCERRHAIM